MSEQLLLLLDSATGRESKYMNVRELYVRADNDLLKQLKEDRRFEAKSNRTEPKNLADYFSMFANSSPDGGIICVGLKNDTVFTGCSELSTDQVNSLEKTGLTYCPDAKYECKRLAIKNQNGNQDYVLLFHIMFDPNHVVETVSGDAFIRVGDTKHKLTDEEKLELKYSYGQLEKEQEPSGLSYPSDFDMMQIAAYCDSFREKRGLLTRINREDILELSHLGKRNKYGFEANVACALLFGRDPRANVPGSYIRFLRFEGEEERFGEKFNAVRDLRVEGTIPNQIKEISTVIRSQVRDFTRLGKDQRFFSAPEYPETAWCEAVVNACAHRSYSLKNMNIFVKMFDDRIEIESPGAFPPLVTPENIYDMHQPRNPHLMQAMFYMEYVKCAHEGTRRIRSAMQDMNLPEPEFSQEEVGGALVRVRLRNNISHRKVFVDSDAAKIIGEKLLSSLDMNEKRVINYLAEYEKISVSDVQRLTQMTWPAAKKLLVKLEKQNIVKAINRREEATRNIQARYVLYIPNGKATLKKNGIP